MSPPDSFEIEMEDKSAGENFHWLASPQGGARTADITAPYPSDSYSFRIRAIHSVDKKGSRPDMSFPFPIATTNARPASPAAGSLAGNR
ncbi:MAG: hypothetical protein JO353_05685 [Phycisphaerae bacterium]|nr:hypothetical protein [Phycisphaerae bacterium]